jgi:hypothetical protein
MLNCFFGLCAYLTSNKGVTHSHQGCYMCGDSSCNFKGDITLIDILRFTCVIKERKGLEQDWNAILKPCCRTYINL